jgi:serine/threonine protein kinase
MLSHYQLNHISPPLGLGSSGFVLPATRKTDHLDVAIKFIFKDRIPASDGWKKDRGLGKLVPTEVFILRRVSQQKSQKSWDDGGHPGIVKFLDVFEDGTVSLFLHV